MRRREAPRCIGQRVAVHVGRDRQRAGECIVLGRGQCAVGGNWRVVDRGDRQPERVGSRQCPVGGRDRDVKDAVEVERRSAAERTRDRIERQPARQG